MRGNTFLTFETLPKFSRSLLQIWFLVLLLGEKSVRVDLSGNSRRKWLVTNLNVMFYVASPSLPKRIHGLFSFSLLLTIFIVSAAFPDKMNLRNMDDSKKQTILKIGNPNSIKKWLVFRPHKLLSWVHFFWGIQTSNKVWTWTQVLSMTNAYSIPWNWGGGG